MSAMEVLEHKDLYFMEEADPKVDTNVNSKGQAHEPQIQLRT